MQVKYIYYSYAFYFKNMKFNAITFYRIFKESKQFDFMTCISLTLFFVTDVFNSNSLKEYY